MFKGFSSTHVVPFFVCFTFHIHRTHNIEYVFLWMAQKKKKEEGRWDRRMMLWNGTTFTDSIFSVCVCYWDGSFIEFYWVFIGFYCNLLVPILGCSFASRQIPNRAANYIVLNVYSIKFNLLPFLFHATYSRWWKYIFNLIIFPTITIAKALSPSLSSFL